MAATDMVQVGFFCTTHSHLTHNEATCERYAVAMGNWTCKTTPVFMQRPLCTCGHKAHPNKECPMAWESAHDGVRYCGCVRYEPRAA